MDKAEGGHRLESAKTVVGLNVAFLEGATMAAPRPGS